MCTNLILFFSVSVAEFQQIRQVILIKICTYTTTRVVHNLVIMKAIDGLSSETIVRLFYKHNTIATEFCGTIPSDYKDHELNAVTLNNLYCKGISAI